MLLSQSTCETEDSNFSFFHMFLGSVSVRRTAISISLDGTIQIEMTLQSFTSIPDTIVRRRRDKLSRLDAISNDSHPVVRVSTSVGRLTKLGCNVQFLMYEGLENSKLIRDTPHHHAAW